MVLTGFLLLAASLANANDPLPFTIGVAAAPLASAVFVHLLLAFPQGHLHSGVERGLVVLTYLTVTVGQWVMLLFMDYRDAPGCPCPRNLLFVFGNDALHAVIMTTLQLVGVVAAVAVVVLLARRWQAASPPLRRSLEPVLLTGAMAAGLFGLGLLAIQLSLTSGFVLDLATGLAIALVPLGFLIGLVRSRFAQLGVGGLVIELGRSMAPGELRGALARTLGDPSLQVAYRLPDTDTYVDLTGHQVGIPPQGATQAVTYVERSGQRIAAVVHDASLNDNPSLVEAACAAAGLAMENERLQADLRARLEDLRSSRARIVQAADTERRRLERNLHDGAQQRLVSVSYALGLAESKLPADATAARSIMDTARQELSQSLEELRELARGIHPAVLSSRGLGVAVQALAMTAPFPVDVMAPPGRLPEPVEAAAYYLIAEALANATKHANATSVQVAVSRIGQDLILQVHDDGRGGANISAGTGLRGLADRVEALDGTLSVTSESGRGTTIRASIPCG
jgi:signal transduction histidine kinase